jgi:hypothetical protein
MDVRALGVPSMPERRLTEFPEADGQSQQPGQASAHRARSIAVAISDPAPALKQRVNVTSVGSQAAAMPDTAGERPAAEPSEVQARPVADVAQVEPATAASEASPAPPSASAVASPDAPDSASAVPGRAPAASAPVALRYPEKPVPTYKTKIPAAYNVEYEIRRGVLTGTGELSWRPSGSRYEAQLKVGIAGFALLSQTSEGGFDAAGLAPVRFTDQRARKAARAANFQRDAGKITFSGPKDEFALPAGTQDRLSWMIQLSAILSANPKLASPGAEVVLYVSGVRADVSNWTLRCIGTETIETAAGPMRTVKFSHVPRSPDDLRSEVWLDPTRHHLPVRARLTQGDQDEGLDLVMLRVSGPP